jgi:hypothetical protein
MTQPTSPSVDAREILDALRPFARAAKQIPDDLPDELWTSCSSYEYDMDEESFERLKSSGVPLLSRKVKLQLWIDGHSLSDFRRAAKVFAALSAPRVESVGISAAGLAAHMARLLYNDATLDECTAEQRAAWLTAAEALMAIYDIRRRTVLAALPPDAGSR